jgi:plasmid maintenance system antidote protein VapI
MARNLNAVHLPAMAKTETGGRNAPHAVRIRSVRFAERYPTAKAFAEAIGVQPPRLANIENGHPLSIDVAQRIVRRFPWYSLDWLYNGREDALNATTRQALREASEKASTTASRS